MTGTLELTLAAQLGTEGQLQQDQGVDHSAAMPEGPRASEAHGAQRVPGAPLGQTTSVLEGNMDSGCDTKCHILLERERERARVCIHRYARILYVYRSRDNFGHCFSGAFHSFFVCLLVWF